MDNQIIILAITVPVIAALIGGYIGARIVYKRMSHRRAVACEQARHDKMATQLKDRLERRLEGRLEEAIEIAKKEKKEAEKHRIEARVLADHEVEDIGWIFQDDNLRDYYNGTVLADSGWFDRNEVRDAKNNLEDTLHD